MGCLRSRVALAGWAFSADALGTPGCYGAPDEDLPLSFFQAEDGIRGIGVTGFQTCALPIYRAVRHKCLALAAGTPLLQRVLDTLAETPGIGRVLVSADDPSALAAAAAAALPAFGALEAEEIGRASGRERV